MGGDNDTEQPERSLLKRRSVLAGAASVLGVGGGVGGGRLQREATTADQSSFTPYCTESENNADGSGENWQWLHHCWTTVEETLGVKGVVQNIAGEVYDTMTVQAMFYDDEDTVLDDNTAVSTNVRPGQKTAFLIKYYGMTPQDQVERYEVYVWGYPV